MTLPSMSAHDREEALWFGERDCLRPKHKRARQLFPDCSDPDHPGCEDCSDDWWDEDYR